MSSKGASAMGEKSTEESPLAPRLRFQTFLFEQAWVPRCLGEIARFTSGGTPSKDEPSYWNGSIPWISASSMYETRIADSEQKVTTSAIGNGTRIAPKGSLLVLVRGSMLFNRVPIGIAAVDVAFNQDVKALSIHGDANTSFLLYQLIAASGRIPVNETGIGAGKIETDVLAGLPIYLPSSIEQQKIADCLSSLDELITAETQKLDALKTHNKSLMQRLFPREGETVPRLRFPEFREAGEWAEKALGDAATFYNGRAYAKEELLERGKYKVIRVGNFFTSDRWYHSNLELDDAKYCDDGDLLYAWSASFGPRIWRGSKSIYHYHIWKVVEKIGVSKEFLFIALDIETERMKARSANGIGMFHITKATIESWMSMFPALAEQEKIAHCLSSVDDLISAQNQKIDTLKAHKKGLIQQLFPVLDEAQA